MCKWRDTVTIAVPDIRKSRAGERGREYVEVNPHTPVPADVDRCIALIVKALNVAGLITVQSCCGHGKQPGSIALVDGREVFIVQDYATARALDKILT